MSFVNLPPNSEKLLLELVKSDNPTLLLKECYSESKGGTRIKLDGIVRELVRYDYIDIKWSGNMPYIVTLNNSARAYIEQRTEYEGGAIQVSQNNNMRNKVFISHRSIDKEIADMLLDFFTGTAISNEAIFCSSLPGNDVNEKISADVKDSLKKSVVNIAILSRDYYKSAYCLNEAGIMWYEDENVHVIPIALPEINSNNMHGFLNSEYKLRSLDCDTDIAYIYDTVTGALSVPRAKTTIFTAENKKLMARYAEYIKHRELSQDDGKDSNSIDISEITTDDERIVLYYILNKSIRKVDKAGIKKWLNENEIYDVNIDNAFDLLSYANGGKINDDILEFGMESFRKYTSGRASALPILKECVDNHTKLAVDTFKRIWDSDPFDNFIMLFIAYIIEERISVFGDRWMAGEQIKSIEQWEGKNSLDSTLSSNYGRCLEFFVQNDFVYASQWTEYGNAREYTLCSSLQRYLYSSPKSIIDELNKVKEMFFCDYPF